MKFFDDFLPALFLHYLNLKSIIYLIVVAIIGLFILYSLLKELYDFIFKKGDYAPQKEITEVGPEQNPAEPDENRHNDGDQSGSQDTSEKDL
jgi:hypothetical protein